MAPSAGKVTPKDSELAAALERRFPALPPRGALFQTLNDAKFDVSGGSGWLSGRLSGAALLFLTGWFACRSEHGADAAEGHEVGVRKPEPGRVGAVRQPGGECVSVCVLTHHLSL